MDAQSLGTPRGIRTGTRRREAWLAGVGDAATADWYAERDGSLPVSLE